MSIPNDPSVNAVLVVVIIQLFLTIRPLLLNIQKSRAQRKLKAFQLIKPQNDNENRVSVSMHHVDDILTFIQDTDCDKRVLILKMTDRELINDVVQCFHRHKIELIATTLIYESVVRDICLFTIVYRGPSVIPRDNDILLLQV